MPSEKRQRQRAGRAARVAELQQAQRRRQRGRRAIIIGVIIAAVIGLVIYTGTRGNGKKASTSTATSTTKVSSSTTAAATPTTVAPTPPTAPPVTGAGKITGTTPCPKPNGPNPHITTFAHAPPDCLQAGKTYTATFVTTEGNIVVRLNTQHTPMTANNFIVLSRYHYYDDTAMFRTDTSIDIIQGGSPHTQNTSDPGPGYTIKDEGSGYLYVTGDLVMARTAAANSAGAQYFFCAGPACSNLDSQGNYVTFGLTSTGSDVLMKILGLNVNQSNGLGGAPSKLVLVKTVEITES